MGRTRNTTKVQYVWPVAQKTALARGKLLQRKSLPGLCRSLPSTAPPAYNTELQHHHYFIADVLLAVSFVISTYLVAYLPISTRPLFKSISRVSAVRIVPASAEASAISLFTTLIAMSPVLPMILRVRQIAIGQISAPNDCSKIPDPTALKPT